MRVVAGEARGRRLVAPEGADTRPTRDRVREATFNALGSFGAVADARVLDLFAGSGAMGIEALSRGAAHATFVDNDREACRAVTANLSTTGFSDRAEVVTAEATAHLRRAAAGGLPGYDLVVLDPPYDLGDGDWQEVFESLVAVAPEAVLVVEAGRAVPMPDRWDVLREKSYGSTLVTVLVPQG